MRRISALRYVFLARLRLVNSRRKASRALNCSHLRVFTVSYCIGMPCMRRICGSNYIAPPLGAYFFPSFRTIGLGGDNSMHDKNQENGAAKMAWELFEKTGSISYYMLYYDLMRKE